jgi:hypothetical protein
MTRVWLELLVSMLWSLPFGMFGIEGILIYLIQNVFVVKDAKLPTVIRFYLHRIDMKLSSKICFK